MSLKGTFQHLFWFVKFYRWSSIVPYCSFVWTPARLKHGDNETGRPSFVSHWQFEHHLEGRKALTAIVNWRPPILVANCQPSLKIYCVNFLTAFSKFSANLQVRCVVSTFNRRRKKLWYWKISRCLFLFKEWNIVRVTNCIVVGVIWMVSIVILTVCMGY